MKPFVGTLFLNCKLVAISGKSQQMFNEQKCYFMVYVADGSNEEETEKWERAHEYIVVCYIGILEINTFLMEIFF